MLDQQDIKQIGNIVEEKVDTMGKGLEERLGVVIEEKIDKAITEKIIPRVTEVIHKELGAVLEDNILPQFEGINSRLDKVESRLDKVESRLDKVGRDMVTKDYLDDKLGDLKGDIIARERKQDKKVNFLIESLDADDVLPDSDIKLLRQMEVFPSPSRSNI